MEITQRDLAEKLASVAEKDQLSLLQKHSHLVNLALVEELRAICYESWYSNPDKTRKIVFALNSLYQTLPFPEVKAVADWSSGIGEIINGKMRPAIEFLDIAEKQFLQINKKLAAAETQVGKLYALAMLGLYEEALQCGLRVRQVFLENNDFLAAGKIELNLGNIYQKLNQYEKAETFLRNARQRFEKSNEFSRLTQIDNSLANSLAHQHKFADAERIYQKALQNADAGNQQVLKAEIESNLGHLLLFQGRFDRALQFFESSRRRYSKMNMPHQSAIAEQEIADTYLELNLIPEAAKIYENVTKTFAELELKSDKARALAYFARACSGAAETAKAHQMLDEAKEIYQEENNQVGLAIVKLIEAKLFYQEKNYLMTLKAVEIAEPIFITAGLIGRALDAHWLAGESLRLLQKNEDARKILEKTLEDSLGYFIPQVTLRCYCSLGLLEKTEEKFQNAKSYFEKSISIVEEMRSPLPMEDFRLAFLADKLLPYQELMNLYLQKGGAENIKQAFILAENARSRVLLEMLNQKTSDSEMFESNRDLQGVIRLEQLREEINWLHTQINRRHLLSNSFDFTTIKNLQKQIQEREKEFLEIKRKQQIFKTSDVFENNESINFQLLQKSLGDEIALVEFLINEEKISAFIVTNKKIEYLERVCAESELNENLESLNLQIERMRFQLNRNTNLSYNSKNSTQQILKTLYQKLIKPLEEHIGLKHLVIVPHKKLHYVPFQALFDGFSYLIETREVSYSPSAGVFLKCLAKKKDKLQKALFVGVNDEQNPQVLNEVEILSKIFPESSKLLNAQATRQSLQKSSPFFDIIHFACHGKFRPDNPLFSALLLTDGWFNVNDASALNLNSGLVVLSACETGINSIAPGDEVLGLARGFFSAGASSLILSFWQIDDKTTVNFMNHFYQKLKQGLSLSTALRMTQIHIMQEFPHPFYWSPFILIGSF